MPELVVNISNILSPLCYSLIRIEPYDTCMFNCIYCYSRWYWIQKDRPKPRYKALLNFRSIAREIWSKKLLPIPGRLSTLSDPFQPIEKKYKISYKIMKVAERFSYPLIINTKSTLLLEDPWIEVLRKLSEKKQVIVQFSIASFDEDIGRKLEPLAPAVNERLNTMRDLAKEGVIILLRISPYIPGISLKPYDYSDVAKMLSSIGVRQVIVEGLRLPLDEWKVIARLLGINVPSLSLYSIRIMEGGRPLYKPSIEVLIKEYKELMMSLKKYNIGFSTCKEGLFSLHTVEDCCGFYFFEKYAKRITLYEIFKEVVKKPLHLNEVDYLYSRICEKEEYICDKKMNGYPKRIRKPLRAHEKKLLQIIRDKDKLAHITPEIVLEDSYLKAKPLISFHQSS